MDYFLKEKESKNFNFKKKSNSLKINKKNEEKDIFFQKVPKIKKNNNKNIILKKKFSTPILKKIEFSNLMTNSEKMDFFIQKKKCKFYL